MQGVISYISDKSTYGNCLLFSDFVAHTAKLQDALGEDHKVKWGPVVVE